MAKNIKTSHILWGIFALAICLRLIYYSQVHNQLLFQAIIFDAKYYDNWARQILTHGWLGKGIFFVSPLYAYFLALIYNLGGDPVSVKCIQFCMGSLVALIIYAIGVRLFTKRVGLIAALISCFYGPAIFFEGLLLKTSLEVFLTCASIFILLIAKDKNKNLPWFLSGVVMGLSVLAKDTTLLLIPLVIVWIYFLKGSFDKSLKPILSYALGAFLIIGALTARNIIIGKDFVLTTYSGGMNFHMGNFRGADGALKEPDFIRIDPEFEEIDSKREAERRTSRAMKPSEISNFWYKETVKEIMQDPSGFLNLLVRKTGLLINRTGLSDNYQMAFFKRYSPLFKYALIGFWPIVVLGLGGIIFAFLVTRQYKKYGLLLIFFFGSSFLLIIGHIIDRYREILVPELILFAAYFLCEIYDNLKKRRLLIIVSASVTIALLTMLTSLRFPNFDQVPYADAYNQLGLLYHEKGDYDSAAREYKNALSIRPNHLWAIQNLADIYLRQGKVEEAILQLKKGIRYRPDVLELYVLLKDAIKMKGLSGEEIQRILNEGDLAKRISIISPPEQIAPSHFLGVEYMAKKEYDLAVAQFQKVIDVSPDSISTLINLGVTYRAKGEPQKAILCYERVLKIAPEIIIARYNLAMILMSQGRFQDAIPHLEQIVNLMPEYALAQFYLANAYKETGQMNRALEEYKKIIRWAEAENTPQSRHLAGQIKEKIWFLENRLKNPQDNKTQDMFLDEKGYK